MIDDDLFNQRETILWVYRQMMHTIEMYKKKKKVSGDFEESSNWIRFSTHRGLETFITRNQLSINEGFLPLRQV